VSIIGMQMRAFDPKDPGVRDQILKTDRQPHNLYVASFARDQVG
jgi:hypothetical protein